MRQLILHNIRSAYNVGSIFRTAEGAGVKKIYLTGYTPTPIDRFGRKRKDIAKVALGAEDMIEWERCDDIYTLISDLNNRGQVVAVEQSPDSINHTTFKESQSVTYIFGNEVEGIKEEILNQVDTIIEIPMKGEKKSLNVAVSVGIILFKT